MAEQKPYIRYEISASVNDKGIVNCIDTAAQAFLRKHNSKWKVTIDLTSKNCYGVVELFDNGIYDFSLEAFTKHLNNSGRLPSKEPIRPEVFVRPLPCDGDIVIHQDSPDIEVYQKSIDKLYQDTRELEDRLKQRESTIGGLNEVLQERQTALDESTKKITSLEQRVLEARPKQYATAIDATINGYLMGALETYIGLSIDINELKASSNLDIFEKFVNPDIALFQYFNEVHKTTFKNDQEFVAWKKNMEAHQTWEDTSESKELLELRKDHEVNESILSYAQQKEANSAVLDTLRANVLSTKLKMGKLESGLVAKKIIFDTQKQVYTLLEDTKVRYESFRSVGKNSNERKKAGAVLPIVIDALSDPTGFQLIMPYRDEHCDLKNHLCGVIQTSAARTNCPTEFKVVEMGECEALKINSAPTEINKFGDFLSKTIREIAENNLLSCLGVTTNITFLKDTHTKHPRR